MNDDIKMFMGWYRDYINASLPALKDLKEEKVRQKTIKAIAALKLKRTKIRKEKKLTVLEALQKDIRDLDKKLVNARVKIHKKTKLIKKLQKLEK